MSRPAPFHVFTPQRDQPEELEKILVKRQVLLESAVDKIRESVVTQDKHRLLFIGPRGMGKSYLVTLIHHRLSNQEDLADKMRFAWLNEDQTSTTFLHLLIRIYRKLSDLNPNEFPAGELDAIRGRDPVDARELLGQSLIRNLQDRTVVLLVENLDATLNSMTEIEQRTWRGFLQDHPCFAIVATAQGLTKNIYSKDKPFFGFFDIHHLDPLTVDEAAELLEKIAALNDDKNLAEFIASARGKARMRAIHHLSGGNPRLYLILSDFLTKDSLDNLVRLFEETVDRQLTPYFQERMRWLSPQQQEIVQFLCQQVHPASVKAIAEGIFTKQNNVSSQLKQLREKGYLVAKSRGKESLYELAEPLMRLSFQVKEMNHRQPLTLIVDFMRVWYDRQDLEKRLADISPDTWGRDYFEVALQKIETEGNSFRHSLMLACIDDIDPSNCNTRQQEELLGIAEETDCSAAWSKYGQACLMSDSPEECIRAMSRAASLPISSPAARAFVLLCRMACYLHTGKFDEAIVDSSAILDTPEIPSLFYTFAAQGRSRAWRHKKNFDAAMLDLTRVIESPDLSTEYLAHALIQRGHVHNEMDRPNEALIDYGKATTIKGIPEMALAEALASRAFLLSQLQRYTESIDDSERVLAMTESSIDSLAKALNVRAMDRARNGDVIGAKSDLDRVCSMPECPKFWLAGAYFGRGALLQSEGNLQEAIVNFTAAADTEETFSFNSFVELAKTYSELLQFEQSLDSIERLLNSPGITLWAEEQGTIGALLINSAYSLKNTPDKWIVAVTRILPLLVKRDFFTGLSTALVMHLETLKLSDLNSTALDRWVFDWENVTIDYPQFRFGIRMLRAGVEWIKTKDESVLLDLLKEERVIVRQALGLDPEAEE